MRAVADIDNPVFKLHYKVTSALLIALCIFVTANNAFGNSISCTTQHAPEDFLNSFCWSQTNYILYNSDLSERYNYDVGDEIVETYRAYYQWIPLTLFLQAILFYVPHWIWKTLESSKIDSIVLGLTNQSERDGELKNLVNFLYLSLNNHTFYVVKYAFCELLNLVTVLVNITEMNKFFEGAFSHYGTDIVDLTKFNQDERKDPLIYVFPRIIKCRYNLFGPSGTVNNLESQCILPQNIINEQIYIFLWFWFITLAVFTSFSILYQIVVFLVPSFRNYLLFKRYNLGSNSTVENFLQKLNVGDYFLLSMLSKNLDLLSFRTLIEQLSEVNTTGIINNDIELKSVPKNYQAFNN